MTRISELLGREKSQVSRALKALNEYGLVERNEDSAYRLGWRLYALAQLAGERRLLETATPKLRRLAVSLGERVHLSVLQGTETLTVLSESSGRCVETVRLGWADDAGVLHLRRTRAAARLDPQEDIERMFADVEFVALGPADGRLPARARARRRRGARGRVRGRRRGVRARSDRRRGPDPGPGRPIIASLNVSAPRFRFVERVQEAAAELTTAAAELTRELGDRALPATD